MLLGDQDLRKAEDRLRSEEDRDMAPWLRQTHGLQPMCSRAWLLQEEEADAGDDVTDSKLVDAASRRSYKMWPELSFIADLMRSSTVNKT